MEIKKLKREYNSCNFCKSGKLNVNGNGLIFDYDEIYELSTSANGGGVKVVACPNCIKQLIEVTQKQA